MTNLVDELYYTHILFPRNADYNARGITEVESGFAKWRRLRSVAYYTSVHWILQEWFILLHSMIFA